jgi:hypothetical protein
MNPPTVKIPLWRLKELEYIEQHRDAIVAAAVDRRIQKIIQTPKKRKPEPENATLYISSIS